jgi:dipeptidyl aminopeptidase/acylaminoacyl peptidase
VQNILKKKIHTLPNAIFSDFSADGNWVFSNTRDHKFWMVNLRNGDEKLVEDVRRFMCSPNSQTVAYMQQKPGADKPQLIIENLGNGTVINYPSVMEFKYNASGDYIAFVQEEKEDRKVVALSLISNKTTILQSNKIQTYSHLTWTDNEQGLAFFQDAASNNTLVHYFENVTNPTKGKIFSSFSNEFYISKDRRPTPVFSADGTKLFFYVELKETVTPAPEVGSEAKVEIWNTKDQLLYPGYGYSKASFHNPSMMASWQVERDVWKFIGDSIHTCTIFGTDAKYAYAYSLKDHSLSYQESEPLSTIDAYNIETGMHTPIVKKPHGFEFQMSPSGRYLAYFKDTNWWVYDSEKDKHTNLTGNLKMEFANSKTSRYFPPPSYGNPGWSADEKQILLYDEHDIWAISPDGKKADRITEGKKNSTIYRIYRLSEGPFENSQFEAQNARLFDLKQGVFLSAHNTHDERRGYFNYSVRKGLQEIVFKNSYIKDLRASKDRQQLVYTEERYDAPPMLMYRDMKDAKPVEIQQSNPQHFKYKWGHSQLVYYTTTRDSLKGALFFPANFDPQKKYPMITFCYERLSDEVNYYQNPTQHNSIGFSVSNYTTQGYFVFYPDIAYKIGDPGVSAVECITVGVKKVLEYPFIDKQKLGLYGHSFGGYESMFILTQTDMFATVVSGAGASNLLSFYLSMTWIWDRPQYTRFEKGQWRMGDSYFNIPRAYERNSPIHQLTNVKTPFLSWAGKHDSNVNWEQHVEMFVGLRRLKKEHIMLLYPEEGHDIVNPKNQIDLTNRLSDWFNHYLKDSIATDWMTNPH